MPDKLTDYLGEEYAASYEGQLYYALENIALNTSKAKLSVLCRQLIGMVKTEDRSRFWTAHRQIDYESGAAGSPLVRPVAKQGEPWGAIPRFTPAACHHIAALIMVSVGNPEKCRALLGFWRSNPERVAWTALNASMILMSLHNLPGLLHGGVE